MNNEVDESRAREQSQGFLPLVELCRIDQCCIGPKSSGSDNQGKNNLQMEDPLGFYRGLESLSAVLARQSRDGAAAASAIPDNVECVGSECHILSHAEAAAERSKIAASGHSIKIDAAHSNLPENVECVGNECRILTPAEVAAEKSHLNSTAPRADMSPSVQIADNVECVGNECKILSPDEVVAEKNRIAAAGNNFELYMPHANIPENVECVGNQCRVLTEEELSHEKARIASLGDQGAFHMSDNVECIGNECVQLSPEQAAAELSRLHEMNAQKVESKNQAGEDVECINGEGFALSPEQAKEEQARIRAMSNSSENDESIAAPVNSAISSGWWSSVR